MLKHRPNARTLRSVRRALLLAAALLLQPFPRAGADDDTPLQRYLAHLYLGDSREIVERMYPPLRDWPTHVVPRGKVSRIRIEAASAKSFPRTLDTMWVGMKKDRVVEILLIYDAETTREKSVEVVADELALIYGEPKRTETKFWWSDNDTVLRVYYTELPVLKGKEPGVELRTTLQIMERYLFQPRD